MQKEQTATLPKVHVFTTVEDVFFRKQFPGFSSQLGGFEFTFGTDVPDDTDVLIVHTRASYSIPTWLPKERTVFFAGEPDVIHPYSTAFLNQFGQVVSTTTKDLATDLMRYPFCAIWFVGFDMTKPRDEDHLLGYDWFKEQACPPKLDKISIVTSNKTFTPYHQKRLEFIREIVELIPDHVELFGHGHRSVDDKKDALLPYRYHLAIENGEGRDVWTEKLSDPYLCWSFPFYSGCSNVADYFPSESFHEVDLDNPKAAAAEMVRMMENGHWQSVYPAIEDARHKVLEEYNFANLLVRIAQMVLEKDAPPRPKKVRMIWSERSYWPEPGSKGSIPEWMLRNTLLLVDKKVELRTAKLQKAIEAKRGARRVAKRLAMEAKSRSGE
jgi:hypothetical protein